MPFCVTLLLHLKLTKNLKGNFLFSGTSMGFEPRTGRSLSQHNSNWTNKAAWLYWFEIQSSNEGVNGEFLTSLSCEEMPHMIYVAATVATSKRQ